MEAPKCRLCGSRHWGACNQAPKAQPTTKALAAKVAAETPRTASPSPDPRLPRNSGAKSTSQAATQSMLAPPGQCPHCDARRAYNAKRVALHRDRKRNITE
jgi:hypothetical protein